jgi:hypothetical protein
LLEIAAEAYDGGTDVISVTSDDLTIAAVSPMAQTDRWVVVGLSPGWTQLSFFVNGHKSHALRISAGGVAQYTDMRLEVTAQ